MNWRDIRVLYRRELRSAFRERTIVMNSVLVPIFLYPLMMWMVFSGLLFVQGLSSREVSRIQIFALPAEHAELQDSLAASDRLLIEQSAATVEAARERVRNGDLDAAIVFSETGPLTGSRGNITTDIVFDRSEDRSSQAATRIEDVLDDYRDRWLEQEAVELGADGSDLAQFRVAPVNVSTDSEMGALLLGVLVPLFLVLMVAIGCFIPAVDSTAGDRERSTWETLMSTAPSRTSIVIAKYLYVATLGVLAGVLNVTAVTASLGVIVAPMLAGANESFNFSLPLLALPVMALGAIALALFFSAAMMILASFAQTFKEGQAMIAPVYWLAILPIFLGPSGDQRLNTTTALIPIVNIAQVIKDAIQGYYAWPLIALSVAEVLVLVVLFLWLARRILQFEDLLMGSYSGSFWKFLRQRLLGGNPKGRSA